MRSHVQVYSVRVRMCGCTDVSLLVYVSVAACACVRVCACACACVCAHGIIIMSTCHPARRLHCARPRMRPRVLSRGERSLVVDVSRPTQPRIVRSGGCGVLPSAPVCLRARPRPRQGCVRIGRSYDYSNAHYGAHYSTAHANPFSNAHYDADLRRWYCPFVLEGGPARADACGRRTPWRSPLGWAVRALRYCHRRARSRAAPARTRARWRHDGMAPSTRVRHARIVWRLARRAGGPLRARCAQGSRTARSTPAPARQASRRSCPRRRAPVRPAYSAGTTVAV